MPRRAPRLAPPRPRSRDEGKRERDAFYSSAAWMRLRAAFLAQNPLCKPCLDEDRVTPATIAHHVVERLEDPRRALCWSNLEPYCGPCHSRHHKAVK